MNGYTTSTGPKYDGPTSAERYCDDLAARRALDRHDLPRPPQLELSAIAKRYQVSGIDKDHEDLPSFVWFMDSSSAERIGNRWEVSG